MNIIIRKVKVEDAERIIDISIAVWNTAYKGLISQELIDKFQTKDEARIEKQKKGIQENNHTYVAEVDGEVVGFCSFGKSRDNNYSESGELYAEYILDDYQGLGLGRKMAVEAMKELLNKGYTTLITKCLDGNVSNEFHKSLGGVFVGQESFEPLGIYIGKENIYYHDNLEKSIEYNKSLLSKNK